MVFPVVGKVGRWVVRSVEVTPSRSASKGVEKGHRSQGLQGPGPQRSQGRQGEPPQ